MVDRLIRAAAAPLLAGCLVLAGCDERSGYPSLAPRAAERPAADAPSGDAPPPATADAVGEGRAAALAAQAVQGDAAFASAADGACRTIAAGVRASEGSEAWIAAQQALSALDAARGPVRAAAAEIDRMLIDGSGAGAPIDTDRLAAADAQVSALDTTEQARIAALSAGADCR